MFLYLQDTKKWTSIKKKWTHLIINNRIKYVKSMSAVYLYVPYNLQSMKHLIQQEINNYCSILLISGLGE